MTTETPSVSVSDDPRRWLALAVIAAATLMVVLDGSTVGDDKLIVLIYSWFWERRGAASPSSRAAQDSGVSLWGDGGRLGRARLGAGRSSSRPCTDIHISGPSPTRPGW